MAGNTQVELRRKHRNHFRSKWERTPESIEVYNDYFAWPTLDKRLDGLVDIERSRPGVVSPYGEYHMDLNNAKH